MVDSHTFVFLVMVVTIASPQTVKDTAPVWSSHQIHITVCFQSLIKLLKEFVLEAVRILKIFHKNTFRRVDGRIPMIMGLNLDLKWRLERTRRRCYVIYSAIGMLGVQLLWLEVVAKLVFAIY